MVLKFTLLTVISQQRLLNHGNVVTLLIPHQIELQLLTWLPCHSSVLPLAIIVYYSVTTYIVLITKNSDQVTFLLNVISLLSKF